MTDREVSGRAEVEDLYQRDAVSLSRFARRSGSREPDDVRQEAFARALTKPPSADPSGVADRAWLRTVAANLVKDRWRRDQRAAVGDARLAASARTELSAPADDLALRSMEGAMLRQALAGLDQEARHVLVMRIIEGRRSDEVAASLGRTPEWVRQTQHRALAALRKELVAKGWDRAASPVLRAAATRGGVR